MEATAQTEMTRLLDEVATAAAEIAQLRSALEAVKEWDVTNAVNKLTSSCATVFTLPLELRKTIEAALAA